MVVWKRPVLSVTLAFVWMVLSDALTWQAFVTGIVMAQLALWLLPAPLMRMNRPDSSRGPVGFLRWVGKVIWLVVYFLWEVVLANWMVTKLVLRPKVQLKPGIIAMQLNARSAAQVTLISSMVTLTPGTISMEVEEDLSILYIHSIDASDEEGTLAVPRRFEQLVMEVVP